MQVKFFNVVWRTLSERKPEEKRRNKSWALIKWLIQIAAVIYKVLKYFFDESGSS